MAGIPLALGVTPILSVPTGETQWQVQLEVDDPTERYSGLDIAPDDVVYLDMIASTNAPGTVARYTVEFVVTLEARTARVVLQWGGATDPVDPVEGAGHRGYLTRPSRFNGLAWHPDARQFQLDSRMIESAKNVEMFAVVDTFVSPANPDPGGGGGGSTVDEVARGRQVCEVPTTRTFAYGEVVTTRSGTGALACPQNPAAMPGVGVAVGMGSGVVKVQTSGLVKSLPYTLVPGVRVWVSNTGTLTQDPASVSRPGELQLMGVAVDATSVIVTPPGVAVSLN